MCAKMCCVVSDFDRTDLVIYEEVARMPPFQRKTMVLVGAQGVGRRTLKQRLCKADPNRFGFVLPCEWGYVQFWGSCGHHY
jgi:hypothetical protein